MSLGRTVNLYTGAKIPLVGLGTWLSQPDEARKAVVEALKVGYRHIDCAYIYQNEHEIGQAFSQSTVPREEIFVTSKFICSSLSPLPVSPQLWNVHHRPEFVRGAVEVTLKNLQISYLDLYLIHWPVSFVPKGTPSDIPTHPEKDYLFPKKEDGSFDVEDVDFTETWKAMEALVDAGLVKHIGLSNFNIRKIQYVLDHARIRPAALQVELHPGLHQTELLEFCKNNNIHVTAYSPLGNNIYGRDRIVDDAAIVEVSKKVGKSPAQVCIAWAAQRGTSVVPKSVTPSRIAENFQDFVLEEEDFKQVSSLGERNLRYNNPGTLEWSCDIFEEK
ncbi:NADP-dependent oxidoreductase domain-containing protein [Endogone sp. FLAS-F59071]|nr:NADP-dependent oxidoreductase domain-containing protein [Endogone sp. FLAS-F59071]|eukprot:RUS19720.1 NADP-dependent oxidoreductase domain-containing protein [Endogone sp. FLAS-F59071]